MHVSPKWYLNDLFSKIDSAPLVGNLIDTYHTNFNAGRDNSLAGSASQKIWYSELFLQLRKWCNLSNGLDGFKAALIACTSHTNNGMHSNHWFPAPLLKLFSDTLRIPAIHEANFHRKDLGHFWVGYIRMLGHLQLSAHWPNFEKFRFCKGSFVVWK